MSSGISSFINDNGTPHHDTKISKRNIDNFNDLIKLQSQERDFVNRDERKMLEISKRVNLKNEKSYKDIEGSNNINKGKLIVKDNLLNKFVEKRDLSIKTKLDEERKSSSEVFEENKEIEKEMKEEFVQDDEKFDNENCRMQYDDNKIYTNLPKETKSIDNTRTQGEKKNSGESKKDYFNLEKAIINYHKSNQFNYNSIDNNNIKNSDHLFLTEANSNEIAENQRTIPNNQENVKNNKIVSRKLEPVIVIAGNNDMSSQNYENFLKNQVKNAKRNLKNEEIANDYISNCKELDFIKSDWNQHLFKKVIMRRKLNLQKRSKKYLM